MAYFDGIKVGDTVWSVEYGWGKVIELSNEYFEKRIKVSFEDAKAIQSYTYDGIRTLVADGAKQTLFWDEIEIEPPQRPKIELKKDYSRLITHKYFSMPDTSIEQLKKFAKLLALRDQECPNSMGYEFAEKDDKYCIFKKGDYWTHYKASNYYFTDAIYFKTEEDAIKICDILNNGKFEL